MIRHLFPKFGLFQWKQNWTSGTSMSNPWMCPSPIKKEHLYEVQKDISIRYKPIHDRFVFNQSYGQKKKKSTGGVLLVWNQCIIQWDYILVCVHFVFSKLRWVLPFLWGKTENFCCCLEGQCETQDTCSRSEVKKEIGKLLLNGSRGSTPT